MKTLFLHIGAPKTGTTAIQNFLTDNAEALKARNFCYPNATKKYPGVSIRRNAHFLYGYAYGQKPNPEEQDKVFTCGMNRINEMFKSYKNIILSDEGIWNLGNKNISALLNRLNEYAERNSFRETLI